MSEIIDRYDHNHSEEIYDEYKTADKLHRITVCYQNGEFSQLQIRAFRTDQLDYQDLNYTNLDELNQLITVLHAAIADIHKKGKL